MTTDSIAMNAGSVSNASTVATAVTVTTVSANNVTNGISIAEFFKYKEPVLVLENTHNDSVVVTLVAGSEAAGALNAGAGDEDITLTAGSKKVIERIEADRFLQTGGALYIDNVTAAGTTLKLYALGKKVGL